jgi:Raf kinase inhibitor-like YbhB/YbcL family protein
MSRTFLLAGEFAPSEPACLQHAAAGHYQRTTLPLLILTFSVLAVGCHRGPDESPLGDVPMTITLTSSAFQEGEAIPKVHTGDGADTTPALQWTEPPAGTKTLALICDDPDAPRGTWVHWVLFNLPAGPRELPAGVPTRETLDNGARQGKNDFGKIGYGGPAPPRGKPHRYFFKLYALDATLNLSAGASKAQLLDAMKGHALAEGQLMGTYKR